MEVSLKGAATGSIRSVKIEKNSQKLTGKHLYQSLFLNKVAGLRLATFL